MRIPSWNFHTIIFKALFGPGPIHTEVKKKYRMIVVMDSTTWRTEHLQRRKTFQAVNGVKSLQVSHSSQGVFIQSL